MTHEHIHISLLLNGAYFLSCNWGESGSLEETLHGNYRPWCYKCGVTCISNTLCAHLTVYMDNVSAYLCAIAANLIEMPRSSAASEPELVGISNSTSDGLSVLLICLEDEFALLQFKVAD